MAPHTAHLGERSCALGEDVRAEAAAAASSKSSEVVDGTAQLAASDFFVSWSNSVITSERS